MLHALSWASQGVQREILRVLITGVVCRGGYVRPLSDRL